MEDNVQHPNPVYAHLHAVLLFVGCLLYGLFGSPTPDSLGVHDVLIGVCFILSIGFARSVQAVSVPQNQKFWKSAGQILLIYGLSVPFIIAAVRGYHLTQISRDVIPFLFLFLPLFLLPILRVRTQYFRSFLFVVLLIGLLFSLRSLLIRYGFSCAFWCRDELLYLENMPTVLFTALYLIGSALRVMARGLTLDHFLTFVILISLSFLPLAAMIETSQRASLGAVVLYALIIQGVEIYRSPVRGLNVLFIFVFVLGVIDLSFSTIFDTLSAKTQSVGLNMRPQETMAVWDVVTADPLAFLFGIGWGGHFFNPAVGGLSVNFTHNFFTSFLLKTGFCGVVLAFFYIVGLLERLIRVIFLEPVIGLAMLAPILIDVIFYASFKSLDFGLMLLMVSSSLVYLRRS